MSEWKPKEGDLVMFGDQFAIAERIGDGRFGCKIARTWTQSIEVNIDSLKQPTTAQKREHSARQHAVELHAFLNQNKHYLADSGVFDAALNLLRKIEEAAQ